MRLSLLLLAMTMLLGAAPQENKTVAPQEKKQDNTQDNKKDDKKETFDPFADPKEELVKRAERNEKEKRFNELKAAAAELKDLSRKMSDEIEAGGQDVISARIWSDLDRAEKLVKVMREKAK
jgi:hypothetical protein